MRRTGVNASTLRAWENRHGLLRPVRTTSGHRLYSLTDVQRVQRLQELLVQGLRLTDIAPLLEQEIGQVAERGVGPLELPRFTQADPGWRGHLLETLRAVEDFSTERLDTLYNEVCAFYPIDLMTHKLLVPVLEQLGERWEKRDSGIAEEHFFSAWLRNKLGARLHHSLGSPRGKALILACLPHENHEIGLLLCALGILQLGHRVIYLGANMPTLQIARVSRSAHASGIILAGREVADPTPSLVDIAWLVKAISIPVFVGSHYAVRMNEELSGAGAIPVGDNLTLGLRLIESHLDAQVARQRRPGRSRVWG